MSEQRSVFLICTVGGTAEPVVQAIKHWKPTKVCFIHTPQSKPDIAAKILPAASAAGFVLDIGRYEPFELPDGQELERCLDRLSQLTPEVQRWIGRDPTCQVAIDFTGGTKCMSVALALQARQWPCMYSYVGGTERTKDGLGVVITGTERVVHQANPWNALGAQAIEEYIMLFDQLAFGAAVRVVTEARRRATRDDRKSELTVLEQVAKGFEAWERFDHKDAASAFRDIEKRSNDLRSVMGRDRAERLLHDVKTFAIVLDDIHRAPPPSRHHVLDLLANARRRHAQGRHDDAVARLYRAIEAHAQVVLRESHGIASTAKVPFERVPPPLQQGWAPKVEDGSLKLGLQEAYALLDALGDHAGAAFKAAKLDGHQRSPLAARNQSILAHGFERVDARIFNDLWRPAIALTGCQDSDLPVFPRLGDDDVPR